MCQRIAAFVGLLCLSLAPALAQQINHLPGRLIVRLGADVDAKDWLALQQAPDSIRYLGYATNILLVHFDHDIYRESELFDRYARDPMVRTVQYDHPIAQRARPNDTRYLDQWQYNNVGQINGTVGEDLDIERAWDVTTGGRTANGDTIVVAVLDSGADLDHEDLVANLWRNHDEIPNNGIDDDLNGYIDDYVGFDTENNDGDPDGRDSHGTSVAGIIGATGNNGIGVTGVNWTVQLMIIRNGFLDAESELIEAYGYALDARLEYEATGGAAGAYVVVTNASWGRDFGDVADSPIWCDLYDQLGEAGILNTGAAANLPIDVERDGDLPTNCPSDYLIGVTNIDTNGDLVSDAAFGNESIDLAAYGNGVFTTELGNTYGVFGGTSSATPHVAGAAALLYSTPCAAFAELLRADPPAAARYVRSVLLESATDSPELTGKTATGGRLDIGAAMDLMLSGCDDCIAPTSFRVEPRPGSATELVVDYKTVERITSANLRYRAVGAGEWIELGQPELPLTVADLEPCVGYEFELTAACGDEELPAQLVTTSTDGCCANPGDLSIVPSANGIFSALYSPILIGDSYRLRYRPLGTDQWLTGNGSGNQIVIGGAEDCTAYEFQFRTSCTTGEQTEYEVVDTLFSRGCGACLEEEYCIPAGYSNAEEWIRYVNVGNDLEVASGRDPLAYADNSGEELTVVRGGTYPVRLAPGLGNDQATVAFRVYVDWNQDGFFTNGEIVGDVSSVAGEEATFNLEVPTDAPLVSTRMRVVMQFLRFSGGPCSPNKNGEVEDYCFSVVEPQGCPPPPLLYADYDPVLQVTNIVWRAAASVGNEYRLRYRPRDQSADWIEENVTGLNLQVADLDLCRSYEIEIASLCDGAAGPYNSFRFLDDCTDAPGPATRQMDWRMYPNPAAGRITIKLPEGNSQATATLFSAGGRAAGEWKLVDQTTINLNGVPPGLYLVRLTLADGRRSTKKLVVR